MSTKLQKKNKQRKEGVCKLTGKHGRFVAAHILPRALTMLSRSGEKARETALGARPRFRPPTWYDNELVIREGEDILEAIDTPAIEALRKHRLVWSSFNCDEPFSSADLIPISADLNLREISVGSADELRLFFLSIVWRAAASSRPEFADVQIANETLDDLRRRVLSRDGGDAWDYPVVLDQLITRGVPQNRTPIVEDSRVAVKGIDDLAPVSSIRIYLDGLVARVMLARGLDIDRGSSGIFLGTTTRSFIFARTFDQSRTKLNMLEVIADNIRRGHS